MTLNVDGLGAVPLRSSPGVELSSGTIIQGTPYVALYNQTNGEFYLRNFYGNPYNIPLCGGLDYWGTNAPNSSFIFPAGEAISRTHDLWYRRRRDKIQCTRQAVCRR